MTNGPTDVQLRVATALGLDLSGDSRNIAAARIRDAVAEAIGDRQGQRPATAKQLEYAHVLGLDVSRDTVRVASARIEDELNSRNQAALVTLNLNPETASSSARRSKWMGNAMS